VGGNLAFGRSGVTIIAHEKTRAHLATDYYLQNEDRYEEALPAEARPTVTFFTGDKTLSGKERIEYGHLLEAHTDGDIYVFFRDANVLAAGDAISPLKDPVLDWFGGGWLGGRVDAQEKLLKLTDEKTRIVPSHGAVVGRAELQAEFDMTRMLFDRMLEMIKQGMSAQDMLDAGLMKGLNRTFRDPFRFAYDAHKGFWAHHNTLGPNVL
jgi:glyoxylase-like metal-dependent hydrolase (beta-lactamase superfamily II)